ncbi:MAG: FHA domain-containing protein [Aeriscardovia sp.]|nr:FHA domain-containing protein [Aeriscardovia sp.]MBO6071684.1 FHA domain-containing protein [Aeriscardovia sp.]MBO7717292.1 FHA domain-containing protein [Aeriscardovia sp.]
MTELTYAVLKYSFILALILFAWLAVRSLHKDVSAFLPSRDKWIRKRKKQMREARDKSSFSSSSSSPRSSASSSVTQTSIVSLVTHVPPSPSPVSPSRSDTTVLVIVDGQNAGMTFPLPPSCTIGRAPDNSIVVPDQFISSHHARIYKSKKGEWVLEDLGSTNGTYLDEKQIAGPVIIKPGQLIRLGATSFELR